jgi:hypothetical protein
MPIFDLTKRTQFSIEAIENSATPSMWPTAEQPNETNREAI